jgi:pullulanase/glycogen debranching enzyme
MPARPTGRYGLLRIPGPAPITAISIRFSPLTNRDTFDRTTWPVQPFVPSPGNPGWWDFDLDALGLADGVYEYEFIVDGDATKPVADPYADEITRFAGYRGVFHIAAGARVEVPFRWNPADESRADFSANNQIVIYEMPIRWMQGDKPDGAVLGLGTFEETVFAHLSALDDLGINCIELLPVEDSPQTLNWGYGTRFFFAPDIDLGAPIDARFFVKSCHALGIRVILDVVMAFFADECPLAALAPTWFVDSSKQSQFGGKSFLYYPFPSGLTYSPSHDFLCEMAKFWVDEYHIDGFRIDDFPDINNWNFVQDFRDQSTAENGGAFPGKPFFVVAEDSNREFSVTDSTNASRRPVADAIWNFGFQDEIRRLATGSLTTVYGQPSRTCRVKHLLSNLGPWNAYTQTFDVGYRDLTCAVNYATSHDVAGGPRMMNTILGPILQQRGLGDGGVANVKATVDQRLNPCAVQAIEDALARVFGVFALIMTSVGVPMFLAGEEFGDVHDLDYEAATTKQEDPVRWSRATYPPNAAFRARVKELVTLRVSQASLQRNEIQFFYFHPNFDQDPEKGGTYVFAYARIGGSPLGSPGQVIVVANMGSASFASFMFPAWPWGTAALTEVAPVDAPAAAGPAGFTLSLDAFEVRVFTS